MQGGVFKCRFDEAWTVIDADESLFRFLGYSRQEFQERFDNQMAGVIHPDDLAPMHDLVSRQLARGNVIFNENRLVCKDGTVKWIWVSAELLRDTPQGAYFNCMFHDITGQKDAQAALSISERRYNAILKQAENVIYEWDCATGAIYWSPNYAKSFGYSPPATGFPQCMLEQKLVHPEDAASFAAQFAEMRRGEPESTREYRLRTSDGKYLWRRVSAVAIADTDGKMSKVIGMLSDINAQKQQILRVQEKADRDALTGLFNRGAIETRVGRYMQTLSTPAALMVIDVDNFKGVNDTFGHIYGDAVLSDMAYNLQALCASDDLAGRMGGDEFIYFMTGLGAREEAETRAAEIGRVFLRSFEINGLQYETSGSIGLAFYPQDGTQFWELFEKADLAAYHSKRNGKNRYTVYDASLVQTDHIPQQHLQEDESIARAQKTFHDNVIEYLFRIFSDNRDINRAIPILLDLMGKIFGQSRAGVFERSAARDTWVNTFSWSDASIPPPPAETGVDTSGKLPLGEETFDEQGLLVCADVRTLSDSDAKDWFTRRGTASFVLCSIEDDGQVAAVISFEDCVRARRVTSEERSAMALVAQTISLFLLRARKQERLDRQQRFSNRLLRMMNASMYAIQPKTYRLTFLNEYSQRHMPELHIGDHCYAAIRGRRTPCEDCPMHEITGQESVTKELYHNKSQLWTETTASFVEWEHGECVCLLSSVDITRYRADRVRIEYLDRWIEGGMVGVYIEPGFPVYFVNDFMCNYLGFDSREEYIAHIDGLFEHGIHPDDRERVASEVNEQLARAERAYQTIYRMQKKDGSYFWVQDKGRQITAENGKSAIISLCVDITERRDLENQLMLYRNAARGGAFIVRLHDFRLLYANDIFYQVHESTPDKIGSCSIEWVHPDDRQYFRQVLETAIREGRETTEWEMRIRTDKGKVRWLLVYGAFEKYAGDAVVQGFVVDVTEQHKLREEIARSEERYRIALAQAHIDVWEYDMGDRRILFSQNITTRHGETHIVENVPESMLQSDIIHPNSRNDLRALYRRLHSGEKRAEADICTRTADGKDWWWERITYTVVFDAQGQPVRAVGVGEDITRQKKAEIEYQQELQMRNALTQGLIASSRTNLERDQVEFIQRAGAPGGPPAEPLSYEKMMEIGASAIANPDDLQRYYATLSRKSLLEAARAGKDTVTIEYRRKGENGNLSWVSATANLVRDALNGEIYAYGMIRDIDQQKTMELSLKQRAERDPLTGAYHRDTAVSMIRDAIRQAWETGRDYAFLLFNIDDFGALVHKSGYQHADEVLKELTTLLHLQFGGKKIIGRFHGDELAVWLGDVDDLSEVFDTAEKIRRTMSMPYMFPWTDTPLSVSVGITHSEGRRAEIQQLYQCAKRALDQAKNSGKNQCVVYGGCVEPIDPQMQDWLSGGERISNTLTETQEGILLRCAFSLTSTPDFRHAVFLTLRDIGAYYQAQRVYLIEPGEDGVSINHFYEWHIDSIPPKKRTAEQRWLTAEECAALRQRKVVFIEDVATMTGKYAEVGRNLLADGVRSMYAAIMEQGNTLLGCICVENITQNAGELGLLESVRHFITNELAKHHMQEKQQYLSYHDALTGLLNRNSYLQYIDRVSPETLLSMGCVSVDINGLKQFNTQYGHQYGDQVVKCTADTLRRALPGGLVYRFAGDEFLAICENLTADAFEAQVERFRKEMEEAYAGAVSVGFVWANTDIDPERLIGHADEKMLLAKQEYYTASERLTKRHDPQLLQKLLCEIKAGMYRLYLQPKASIKNGKIVGAEALVRYVHPDTGLVTPDRFIPQLEHNGMVHYIDLHIFEAVCATLKKWIDWGAVPLTISLNFSRATLLQERLIERMDEIYQQYGIPKHHIEIEITESIGAVERETILRIGSQIVEQGYRLSLDDFGAKYSNLSILSALPLHVLKLDKSLVNDLFSNRNTRVVVRNFLTTCRELNIDSVAEGVETVEQLEILRRLGCDLAQGYYFNKPIPLEAFEESYLW